MSSSAACARKRRGPRPPRRSIDRDDVRMHGKDERVKVDSYYTGVEFYYRFLDALTRGNP
ncbi:MAG TPA: hypothetical protein VNX69_15075 [Steroidobacteraceae bacterium]|nr:hypothetical protein [Steroidobacteraceae bacterium]